MSAPTCEMIVGYLVPHRCPNRALGKCQNCGRQFCDEHLNIEKAGLICTACQQGLKEPILVAETARTFDEEDLDTVIPLEPDAFYDSDDLFADLS